VSVRASFAGAPAVERLRQGEPGDVVLVRDRAPDAGMLASPVAVARYETSIIVWRGAAARVRRASDLGEPGLRLGDGTPESTTAVTTRATVAKMASDLDDGFADRYRSRVVTTAPDDDALAHSVAAGAIDAAIIYAADNVPGGTVEVPLPEKYRSADTFAVAVVKASPQQALARQFESLITSAEGAAFFRVHGSEPVR
jgi:ABC-type molybdate transport system substrate-binding protein